VADLGAPDKAWGDESLDIGIKLCIFGRRQRLALWWLFRGAVRAPAAEPVAGVLGARITERGGWRWQRGLTGSIVR
jgi:hypothetical protein